MTVLMAFKLDNGVLITTDRKTSDIAPDGQNLGSYNLTNKVSHIKNNVIMATAGLGELGSNTRNLLHSIFNIDNNVSVDSIIEYTGKTMKFNHELFKAVNPHVDYLDFLAILGGFDNIKEESFLYIIKNTNQFTPEKVEGKYYSVGPGKEIIDNHVSAHIREVNDVSELAKLFSEAIRLVDSNDVSKETLSICTFFEDGVHQYHTFAFDQDGNVQ